MIQDLSFDRLHNEYKDISPEPEDIVICVRDAELLISRAEDDTLTLPQYKRVSQWAQKEDWKSWNEDRFHYVFCLHGHNYFLWMGQAGACDDPEYHYEGMRQFRQLQSKDVCFAALTAWHLYVWYRNNQFCGRCAAPTVHDKKERMLRCPKCGNMIFPRISPAVIVAVTNGAQLLLSKYAGRVHTNYALIAGFTEIGETMEQTVAREVMEEVGLRVKNIRYYKSQPWGIDGNVLMGFYCDLDGDNTVHLDREELAMAQWYPRNALPVEDDGISLTREMIRIFGEGKEPK